MTQKGTIMIVVDANSGEELQVGKSFKNVHGTLKVISISENPPRIELRVVTPNTKMLQQKGSGYIEVENPHAYKIGQTVKTPLQVRRNHPSFPGQVVGFVPS